MLNCVKFVAIFADKSVSIDCKFTTSLFKPFIDAKLVAISVLFVVIFEAFVLTSPSTSVIFNLIFSISVLCSFRDTSWFPLWVSIAVNWDECVTVVVFKLAISVSLLLIFAKFVSISLNFETNPVILFCGIWSSFNSIVALVKSNLSLIVVLFVFSSYIIAVVFFLVVSKSAFFVSSKATVCLTPFILIWTPSFRYNSSSNTGAFLWTKLERSNVTTEDPLPTSSCDIIFELLKVFVFLLNFG